MTSPVAGGRTRLSDRPTPVSDRASARPRDSAAGPVRWRLRLDGPAAGAVNMATDHALARSLGGDEAVLRLYRWAAPTLSLGRNEPARGRYDRAAARRRGIDVVRRPTGGRAVLHHREVTYAVVAPLRSFGGLRAAYHAINAALARGLTDLGVPVGLAGAGAPGGARAPDAGACFRAPAEGEVVAGGGKLVGSAQARIGDALLQHGSILLADDQGIVEALRVGFDRPTEAGAGGDRGVATLAGLLEEAPSAEDVVAAVAEGFRAAMGGRWRRESASLSLPPDLVAHYRSAEWTWRR